MPLTDGFGRTLDYLRISLTDRCNFRCKYCMPASGLRFFEETDKLTKEEWTRLVKVFVALGIRKIRLTGGEPLLNPDLISLVAEISALHGMLDIALTTNGMCLKAMAAPLKEAGLKRINISLDTLDPQRFSKITQVSKLEAVLAGIAEALRVGLNPVKLNVVLLRGVNSDEIPGFIALAKELPLEVRFIELMPARNCFLWSTSKFFPAELAKEKVQQVCELVPVVQEKSEVAQLFQIRGGKGKIGFISPLSPSLCLQCSRLRIRANGEFQLCLHGRELIDLRTPLRSGASPEILRALIGEAVLSKPQGHQSESQSSQPFLRMSQVGG